MGKIVEYPVLEKYIPWSRYTKRVPLHFWVDYIKASIVENSNIFNSFPKLLRLWLSANSTYYKYDKDTYFEFKEIESLSEQYSHYIEIKDEQTGKNLAFFMIARDGNKSWAVTRDSIFEVSGTWLLIHEIEYYYKILSWAWFKTYKYKRVDICMDIAVNIDYLYQIMWLKQYLDNKTGSCIRKKGMTETVYLWDRSKYKNTRQLIRIYNKKLDSKNKGKESMYPQYEEVPFVTRVEIEFRRDKAKFFDDSKVLSTKYHWGLFKTIIFPFNRQRFSFFKYDELDTLCDMERVVLGSWFRKKQIQEQEEREMKYGKAFKSENDERKAVGTFIAYTKKLLNSWYSIDKIHSLIEIQNLPFTKINYFKSIFKSKIFVITDEN